jgi:hypothetical protein
VTFKSSKSHRAAGWSRRRLAAGLAGFGVAFAGAQLLSTAATADFLVAGAAARGVFGWEAIGGYEHLLASELSEVPVEFPLRIEGHFALRDRVTNVVLSTYALAHLTVPGFKDSDFGPYLATGPGLHVQGSWSDLGAFGDVLVKGETALKWHALAGATLVRGARADFYVESRYTKPSPYNFDYIALGVRLHAPDPSRRQP